MTGNLALALTTGVLYAVGTYLLLQRTLTRVVIGLGLLSHGANLLLLQAGGPSGGTPFVTKAGGEAVAGSGGTTADPLPQAMVLTAIVITFGVTAFLLALAYRSWVVHGDDEVQDDVEDRRVAQRRAEDLAPVARVVRPEDEP